MGQAPASWASRSREGVYEELDHPADLFLTIAGRDLPTLFQNALFALYDQMAALTGFEAKRQIVIEVLEKSPAEALRTLLVEALYTFSVEGFVAVGAEVQVDTATLEGGEVISSPTAEAPGDLRVRARLWGENAERGRHALLTEIKAVTFHRLSAGRAPDGTWRATVLMDI